MGNKFLDRYILKTEHNRILAAQRLFTMQWCADAALLAANEVFNRRGKKLSEFHEALMRYSNKIAEMTLDDAKGDKTIEYTRDSVDKSLQAILGKDFVPWDERYRM